MRYIVKPLPVRKHMPHLEANTYTAWWVIAVPKNIMVAGPEYLAQADIIPVPTDVAYRMVEEAGDGYAEF